MPKYDLTDSMYGAFQFKVSLGEPSRYKIPVKSKAGKLIYEIYNPVQDLIVLGYESGLIMVKRSGWKTCWKRELGTEVGINTEAFPEPDDVKPSLLKCLTWSPDGEILVAMMSDGKIHMMSAECGKIYYSFTAHGVYREINWLTFGEGPILEKFKAHDEMINFEFATPERFNFNEEATKQASIVIANVLQFLTETVPEKYYNTILIGIPEEGQKIDLYACGIVYFRTIDVLEDFTLSPMMDPFSIEIGACSISCLQMVRLNVVFKLMEFDNEILFGESNKGDQKLGKSTFVASIDLGYETHQLWTVMKVALLTAKLAFLSIFFREMCQYTFMRIDEKIGSFYEQSLDEMVRIYKMNKKHEKTTFFHEVVKHLSGGKVSHGYIDTVKKKNIAHCVKILDDYCNTKLKNFGTGLQNLSMSVDMMKSIILTLIDVFYSNYVRPKESLTESRPPELEQIMGFYADICVLQFRVEEISKIVNDEKHCLIMLHTYFQEMMNAVSDEIRFPISVDLSAIDPLKLIEFLGKSFVRDDVRIPKGEMPAISHAPMRKAENKFNFRHELINFMKPLGFYYVPYFVPQCGPNCPHAFTPRGKKPEEDQEKRKQIWDEKVPADFEPMVSVYTWHNEKCFDYLCKYFPEYTSSGFPPQNIGQIESKLLENKEKIEQMYPRLRKLLPKHLPCDQYLTDEDVVMKLLLRPTVFMSMRPLFEMQNIFTQFFEKHYPCKIRNQVSKLEQSNENGGPIGTFFLDNKALIEKMVGTNCIKFVNGTFHCQMSKIIPDGEISPFYFNLSKIPKTKRIVPPQCICCIILVYPEKIGDMVFIYGKYDFDETKFPLEYFHLSTLEPKQIIIRNGLKFTFGQIKHVILREKEGCLFGSYLSNVKEDKLFLYHCGSGTFHLCKTEFCPTNCESIIMRKNKFSFILFEQGKQAAYWIQPKHSNFKEIFKNDTKLPMDKRGLSIDAHVSDFLDQIHKDYFDHVNY